MASLYNICSVVICLIAFAAFLRFDELAKFVRSDVKIENDSSCLSYLFNLVKLISIEMELGLL